MNNLLAQLSDVSALTILLWYFGIGLIVGILGMIIKTLQLLSHWDNYWKPGFQYIVYKVWDFNAYMIYGLIWPVLVIEYTILGIYYAIVVFASSIVWVIYSIINKINQ